MKIFQGRVLRTVMCVEKGWIYPAFIVEDDITKELKVYVHKNTATGNCWVLSWERAPIDKEEEIIRETRI